MIELFDSSQGFGDFRVRVLSPCVAAASGFFGSDLLFVAKSPGLLRRRRS